MSEPMYSKKVQRKAQLASLIGSSIEYYDYLLYGAVATLVFNKLFFPNFDPAVGLLMALASFGLPYFFRPLGGVIFSHIGDKLGRKKSLVLTLGIMGVSTALIGLLPTYQSIGIWAPILLVTFRLIQGIAVGGEWGGAVLLAVEYADEKKKGFAGSIPMMGAAVGIVLGTATISLMRLLPDAQFLAWGWRLPFVLSLGLVFVGIWIRSGLDETPDFQKSQKEGTIPKLPIVTTFKYYWREIILTTGAKAIETAPFYMFATFGISYATNNLQMNEHTVLNAVMIGTLGSLLFIPLAGMLSDIIGRKKSILYRSSKYYNVRNAVFHASGKQNNAITDSCCPNRLYALVHRDSCTRNYVFRNVQSRDSLYGYFRWLSARCCYFRRHNATYRYCAHY